MHSVADNHAYYVLHLEKKKAYYASHRSEQAVYHATLRASLRAKCIAAYGGCCQRCRNTDARLLEFHHINGDGNWHRKDLKTPNTYRWMIANNFPPTISLLCANCHKLADVHAQG